MLHLRVEPRSGVSKLVLRPVMYMSIHPNGVPWLLCYSLHETYRKVLILIANSRCLFLSKADSFFSVMKRTNSNNLYTVKY